MERIHAVFIPKPGKSDYSQIRSFQPISLSSFIMKALDRVWAWRLKESALIQNPVSCDHHAFRRGYSTDSALSTMVEYAESAIIQNKLALGVFLDIQGAFDNDSPSKKAHLNRIFYGSENKALGLVNDSNGVFCTTPEASINLLMDTHFPGSVGHMIKLCVAYMFKLQGDRKPRG